MVWTDVDGEKNFGEQRVKIFLGLAREDSGVLLLEVTLGEEADLLFLTISVETHNHIFHQVSAGAESSPTKAQPMLANLCS